MANLFALYGALAMTPTDSDTRSLDLEAVTRDYARYAERAGGLSAVAGGVLCLVS
jgi:hypothetical protein